MDTLQHHNSAVFIYFLIRTHILPIFSTLRFMKKKKRGKIEIKRATSLLHLFILGQHFLPMWLVRPRSPSKIGYTFAFTFFAYTPLSLWTSLTQFVFKDIIFNNSWTRISQHSKKCKAPLGVRRGAATQFACSWVRPVPCPAAWTRRVSRELC